MSPDPDVLLGPSTAAWTTDFQQIRDTQHDDADPTLPQSWFAREHADLRLHLDNGIAFGARYSFVAGAGPLTSGNFEPSVGYRKAWLLLGILRTGASIEVGEGLGTTSQNDPSALQTIAARFPFHEHEFAPGDPMHVALEGRFELVGCHVPFVHLRADYVGWRVAGRHALAVPLVMTVGAYESPWLGVGLSIGVDLRGPERLLVANVVSHFSLLADIRICRGFHMLLHAGAFSGELSGVDIGLAAGTTVSSWHRGPNED